MRVVGEVAESDRMSYAPRSPVAGAPNGTRSSPPAASRNPFDTALERTELAQAARAYALHHGEPGSAGYRAAWLRFRRHIQSIEDLERLRRPSARRKPGGQGKSR